MLLAQQLCTVLQFPIGGRLEIPGFPDLVAMSSVAGVNGLPTPFFAVAIVTVQVGRDLNDTSSVCPASLKGLNAA